MKSVYIFFLTSFLSLPALSGEGVVGEGESFAQEYENLKILLQKVHTPQQAILYKSEIEKELSRLQSSKVGGGKEFSDLNKDEKQLFIKKFQNNNLHCGEVTAVMNERRRILLDPELKKEIGYLITNIP